MPKENSVIICERFMTVKNAVVCIKRQIVIPTPVVDMNVASVAMAESSNVKVCWRGRPRMNDECQ